MYKVVKTWGKLYALKISNIKDDLENIEIFVEEGTPVILVDSLETLELLFSPKIYSWKDGGELLEVEK